MLIQLPGHFKHIVLPASTNNARQHKCPFDHFFSTAIVSFSYTGQVPTDNDGKLKSELNIPGKVQNFYLT